MVNPIPDTPKTLLSTLAVGIKSATPDLILIKDDGISPEIMSDLLFEDIGGQEIISTSRHDLINGQNPNYNLIKNVADISLQYNPKNMILLPNSSEAIFQKFSINLDSYIPNNGTGPNGEIVYLDSVTGNLVINVVGLAEDEQVEVQILKAGTKVDGRIDAGS